MRPLLPVLALIIASCSSAPSDTTPSGTVRLFLDAMERSNGDPEALGEAYALLSAPTRRALAERAHFANALGGRRFEAWEMLVQGRFRLNFAPARGSAGMRERIEGEQARVTVTSADGSRRAEIPLVREDGRWRIALSIPPTRERPAAPPE